MDKRTILTVAVALLVGLHGFAGTVAADTSTTIELDAARDNQSETSEVSFTFQAQATEDVSVSAQPQFGGSSVSYSFDSWENTASGSGGSSSTFGVQSGQTYEVTYEVTAESGASEGRYDADISVSGSSSGSYTIYDEFRTTVSVVEPRFGNIGTQTSDLVFTSNDEASADVAVTIENTGDGLMKPTDVSFSGVPSGFSVDYSGLSNNIQGDSSGGVTVEVGADASVSEGTYEFDATVEDSLGNTESFPVRVTVQKPPVLGIEGGSTIDVGDVLVGTSESQEFTITEQAGYSGIDGVNGELTKGSQYGSLGISGLSYVETSPGGSDTAELSVSVGSDAAQHADLQWKARLEPYDDMGVGKTVTVEARVIYPARFGSLSMSDTAMVFDRPRSEVTSHTKTVTVDVPNEGDLAMNVQNVRASIQGTDLDATVVDEPNRIGGLSDGEVAVEVEADPDTSEGNYALTVVVDSEDAGEQSITEAVTVEHGVELAVEKTDLAYGDVIVTKNLTQSTDVAEALEYRDVTGLETTKMSGPDKWLTVVERPPEMLTAGDAAPLVVALRFDTQATLYQEYTWTYRVTGDNVEAQTVTVSATPKPYSFDQIRDPLNEHTGSGDWRGETASGMVETLDSLESQLRSGTEVSRTDLSTGIAAGRATTLFIDSVAAARDTRESDGNAAAQDEVLRAAAAYNMLDLYVSEFDDGSLRSSATESRSAAERTVTALVGEQTDYYQSQLDGDASMIQRAEMKRELAQLAALRGDDERAAQLRAESDAAFDEYLGLVKTGSEQRQSARDRLAGLKESTLTVVAGQPLLLNPANWDTFTTETAAVKADYDAATESFRQAGATGEVQRVTDERSQVAGQLTIARYSFYGSAAAYLLVFLGLLGHIGRSTYAYVRDARASVSGDFLVSA